MATNADIYSPEAIKNVDLVTLAESLDGAMYEMAYSESAATQAINTYDYERLVATSVRLRASVEALYAAPRADLPFSYQRMYTLEYMTKSVEDFGVVENPGLRWGIRWYSDMMVQLTRSESANISNGISTPDYNRFVIALNKYDAYLADYVSGGDSTDKPQHSSYQQNLHTTS